MKLLARPANNHRLEFLFFMTSRRRLPRCRAALPMASCASKITASSTSPAILDFARASLDEEARTAAYAEIQRLFLDEGPIIVPYFYASFMVMASHVSGVVLHPFSGRTHFREAVVN